nr:MAG TPA: hypothetical protein [Caudoviricetes sp.]
MRLIRPRLCYPSRRHLSANHPVIHMPPAATSWASCLFAVCLFSVG